MTVTRAYTSYEPQWKKFHHPPSNTNPYNHQYSHMYASRLHQLRPRILSALESKHKNLVNNRVIELKEETESVIIGTLVKDTQENSLVLEDESGRVELESNSILDGETIVTGIILGIRGTIQSNGVFTVQQLFFPTLPPISDNPTPPSAKIMLLSGLHFGSPSSTLRHSLLVDYLAGHFTTSTSAISQLIIAGNSIHSSSSKDTSQALLQLDILLSEILASGIPTTLIPGSQHDPTNANLPNQPFHPCLLPHSTTFKHLFHLSTNPFQAKISSRLIIGTDGSNINNTPSLEFLKTTIRYCHMAPTAPDSLHSFPFSETDPFVLDSRPDIYFAGNMETFETARDDDGCGTRMICIPKFEETGEVVVVDLRSLECEVVTFEGLDE